MNFWQNVNNGVPVTKRIVSHAHGQLLCPVFECYLITARKGLRVDFPNVSLYLTG